MSVYLQKVQKELAFALKANERKVAKLNEEIERLIQQVEEIERHNELIEQQANIVTKSYIMQTRKDCLA